MKYTINLIKRNKIYKLLRKILCFIGIHDLKYANWTHIIRNKQVLVYQCKNCFRYFY